MLQRQGEYRSQQSQRDDEYVASENKKECNDVFFLILFLILMGTTIYFAGAYGNEFIKATQIQNLEEISGFQIVLKNVVNSAFIAMGMSIIWIVLMVCAGKILIWIALGVIILLNIAAAYFLTKQAYNAGMKYYYWPAIVFGGTALLVMLYTCLIRKRIRFAAAHLKIAGKAVFTLPMTLIVAIIMTFVHVAWASTWIVGSVGILYHQQYIKIDHICTVEHCQVKWVVGSMLGVLFGMLLVFFWGSNVLKNVIAVTVAGSVASWKTASNSACITMGAWFRAMTLNLGSICFGSLIVSILEAARTILNMMISLTSESGNCAASCLLSCVACIIGCIERWIEFFNRFSYTYIGCYGYSFITASKHVWSLFASKGWSAIVNDDLTNNVFFLGNIIIGAITAHIALHMVDTQNLNMFENPQAIVAYFAFVVGYATNNLFMSVVSSAVTTIFVLWAEDPHGWEITRPEEYQTLHSAWLDIYPEEYNNGHGKVEDGRV